MWVDKPWAERAAYLLLFLFPVAGNSVTGWTSYLFSLLCLYSLFMLRASRAPLERDERILLWLIGGFFVSLIFSDLINGWGAKQSSEFGVQVRYLLFIPLYLMLRRYRYSFDALALGSLVGALVLGWQAFSDIWLHGTDRALGVYISPGLFAMTAFVYGILATVTLMRKEAPGWLRGLAGAALLAALAALVLTGSRSVYVALLVFLMLYFMLHLKWRQALLLTAGMFLAGYAIYASVGIVTSRVDMAVHGLTDYLHLDAAERISKTLSSTEQRLEMWRAALNIYVHNPVFGIGQANFSHAAQRLVDQGLYNPAAAEHPHPHNGYLELMVSEGSVGLLLMLALLIHVLRSQRVRQANQYDMRYWAAYLFSLAFLIYAALDAAPFIYGNFVALLLTYLAALYAYGRGAPQSGKAS